LGRPKSTYTINANTVIDANINANTNTSKYYGQPSELDLLTWQDKNKDNDKEKNKIKANELRGSQGEDGTEGITAQKLFYK
jgi:hypothetical protein